MGLESKRCHESGPKRVPFQPSESEESASQASCESGLSECNAAGQFASVWSGVWRHGSHS